jgi:hypothetical protein
MKVPSIFTGVMLAVLLMAGSAQASTVTESYDFTLGNFVAFSGDGTVSPITSITGSFTLAFNPAVAARTSTMGITENSLNGVSALNGTISSLAVDTTHRILRFSSEHDGPARVAVPYRDRWG